MSRPGKPSHNSPRSVGRCQLATARTVRTIPMRLRELLSELNQELQRRHAETLYRPRRIVESLPAGRCRVNGRELIDFSRNDYLGLSHHPLAVQAARSALEAAPNEAGFEPAAPRGHAVVGATASAQVSGRSAQMAALEETVARFEDCEDALVFPSGFAANVGTITALAGEDDLLLCDRLNHASLIDGCRLSRATFRVYRHDRLERLERELHRAAGYRRRFVVTDSVFSMDGDLAPLADLCDLAERFDATLIVDEAHATGVLGRHGRGLVEACGLEDRGIVRIGTLSKAVGALGGFVAGPRCLVDYIRQSARPYVYSTALPPAVCAAARAALDVIATQPQLRQRLHALMADLAATLRAAGINVGPVRTPIVPVIVRSSEKALALAERLTESGFFVPAIRPPTVPRNTARLRISLSAAHRPEDIGALAQALAQHLPLTGDSGTAGMQ